MNIKPEQAVNNFKNGLNCSQVVLSVYAGELELSREIAWKIAGWLPTFYHQRKFYPSHKNSRFQADFVDRLNG